MPELIAAAQNVAPDPSWQDLGIMLLFIASYIGCLIIWNGWRLNRQDRALDERIRRRYGRAE